jgi:hypothetical protein
MATQLKDIAYFRRLKVISRSNALRKRKWLAEQRSETASQNSLAKRIKELL